MIQIIPLDRNRKADRKRFIKFPYKIYRQDKHWVPPLIIAEHDRLSNKEPFYEHAEAQLFMAMRDGRDVGRIAAIHNRRHNEVYHDKIGFFGFFECENDSVAAQALLEAAGDWIRKRGLDTLRGPFNPSINHPLGLLISGEPGPPMVEVTYNPLYYQELITSSGFDKCIDWLAYNMNITNPETFNRLEKLAGRVEAKERVTTRTIDMKNFNQEIQIIKDIFNEAWEKNWGYLPLTEKEIDFIAADLKMLVDPGLVRFVYVDGKPAGLLVVLLNINEIMIKLGGCLLPFGIFKLLFGRSRIKSIRLFMMGVTKQYRHLGLETVLYYHSLKYAISRGYRTCEISLLLENNPMVIRASKFMGGEEYRRYRIFERYVGNGKKKGRRPYG